MNCQASICLATPSQATTRSVRCISTGHGLSDEICCVPIPILIRRSSCNPYKDGSAHHSIIQIRNSSLRTILHVGEVQCPSLVGLWPVPKATTRSRVSHLRLAALDSCSPFERQLRYRSLSPLFESFTCPAQSDQSSMILYHTAFASTAHYLPLWCLCCEIRIRKDARPGSRKHNSNY